MRIVLFSVMLAALACNRNPPPPEPVEAPVAKPEAPAFPPIDFSKASLPVNLFLPSVTTMEQYLEQSRLASRPLHVVEVPRNGRTMAATFLTHAALYASRVRPDVVRRATPGWGSSDVRFTSFRQNGSGAALSVFYGEDTAGDPDFRFGTVVHYAEMLSGGVTPEKTAYKDNAELYNLDRDICGFVHPDLCASCDEPERNQFYETCDENLATDPKTRAAVNAARDCARAILAVNKETIDSLAASIDALPPFYQYRDEADGTVPEWDHRYGDLPRGSGTFEKFRGLMADTLAASPPVLPTGLPAWCKL